LITLSHLSEAPRGTLRSDAKGKSGVVARGVAGALAIVSVPVVIGLTGVVLVALRSWLHIAAS
jgi:hypothetical protein